MFTVNPVDLLVVRDALRQDPTNFGVGVAHRPSARIALRPFDEVHHRGGHLSLASELGWPADECFGFLVARPGAECVMVNLAHLNAQSGALLMPPDTFRTILLSLRQGWAGMAAS
jgi:hypothetical protein